jgi:hypothetical protein
VWDDIRIDRVLPFRDAKDEDDEKHVHPLQLDVIERFLDLRTLPGETVLTPFMGVGSEVYAAVRMGRYAIGAELKPSYFEQALNTGARTTPPRPLTRPSGSCPSPRTAPPAPPHRTRGYGDCGSTRRKPDAPHVRLPHHPHRTRRRR